jgi:hypothetical protein
MSTRPTTRAYAVYRNTVNHWTCVSPNFHSNSAQLPTRRVRDVNPPAFALRHHGDQAIEHRIERCTPRATGNHPGQWA